MEVLPLYLTLGPSPASRKRRLCSRMEKQSAADAMKGLSTRIPFLKNAMCAQESRSGESVRSEPRSLEKIVPDGHVFGLRANCLAVFRLRRFCEEISRFNSFNAKMGLQAVSVEKPRNGEICYRVTACDISYIGDLRVSRVIGDESGLLLGGGGAFNTVLYGIFLSNEQEYYSHRHKMVHELEHARHHSLWHLSGFPLITLIHETAEYLAMLRTLIDLGEAPQLLAWRNEFMDNRPITPVNSTATPHDDAALRFVNRLMRRYLMGRQEVAMGIAWTFREDLQRQFGQELDPSFSAQFIRMRNAAMGEYNDTYARMFGMPIDDLREVVSRLSL